MEKNRNGNCPGGGATLRTAEQGQEAVKLSGDAGIINWTLPALK